MKENSKSIKKIGIIGGGISGLVAAFLLLEKGFEVALFEKSERVGGNIRSVQAEGFLIEQGPNSLLKSPRLVDLIGKLGLETEVLTASGEAKKRYVLRDGKLKALPMSLAKMAAGDFLSLKGKLRLLKEPFVRSKSSENETVAEFFTRRLGSEIVARAADPFIAGIYAGKPENLSIRAAFPRLFELEKDYGSLLIGSLRSKTEKAPADFPRTFSFKRGVETLTGALAEKLGENIRTNAEVSRLEKLADGKFEIETSLGVEIFDTVIVATPAAGAANLLESLDAELAESLREIYYPPVAMVFFGVKKEFLGEKLNGFGFLIPSAERRKILGTVWNSAVFTNRAPDGFHLLTTFVGGARDALIFEKPDEELFEIVYEELGEILGLRSKPEFRRITRWHKAIPQYNVGYDKIERSIENFQTAANGIFICSNFYKGISVGDCVKNSFALADEIEKRFSHEQTRKGTK